MNLASLKNQLHLPSKLEERRTSWSVEAGITFYIKRDDQIHPFISGNKWRKLSGIFECYPEIKSVWTYGGAYSNHLLATAVACQLLGVKSYASIRGEEPKRWSTVLSLCKFYGMQLHFVSRSDYTQIKTNSGWLGEHFHIPEGGASEQGIIGCKSILEEINTELDHVFIACGTGTSLAGLSAHSSSLQKPPILWGVPVLKRGGFISEEVLRLGGQQNFELILDAHFGGYAKTNATLMEFIQSFARETGILLDPIYSAKAAWAVSRKAAAGEFKRGSKVALIHTGGYTGWFGKWTDFMP